MYGRHIIYLKDHIMKKHSLIISVLAFCGFSTSSYAEENKFFTKIYGGLSVLQDKSFDQDGIATDEPRLITITDYVKITVN